MGAWAVPRRYLPLPMHQRRRLLAAVACYQAARATNTFHRLPSHRRRCMHGCMKRLAQGVIRRRIRTNGCLGRAQEVPPAAHASTEALACGGGVLSSRTCNHNSILALSLALMLHG